MEQFTQNENELKIVDEFVSSSEQIFEKFRIKVKVLQVWLSNH